MASSGTHFRVIPLLSSDRSSNANIFPATLKTRAVSLNGKFKKIIPSVFRLNKSSHIIVNQ
jgi:hypothetical protein